MIPGYYQKSQMQCLLSFETYFLSDFELYCGNSDMAAFDIHHAFIEAQLNMEVT